MRYVLGVLLLASPAAAQDRGRPAGPAPVVVAPPSRPLVLPRGPLRVRLATAASDVIADTTLRMMSEIPRAVAESVRSGNARATFRFSVERTPPRPQP